MLAIGDVCPFWNGRPYSSGGGRDALTSNEMSSGGISSICGCGRERLTGRRDTAARSAKPVVDVKENILIELWRELKDQLIRSTIGQVPTYMACSRSTGETALSLGLMRFFVLVARHSAALAVVRYSPRQHNGSFAW